VTKRFSVVVTTYNEDEYHLLKKCIGSILSQTFTNFELLIVTEKKEIKEKIQNDFNDNRIRLINFDGSGVAEARNRGFESAIGDIVAYTDDDAYPEEKWLEKINEVYKKKDYPCVGGRILPSWEDGCKDIPEEFNWIVGVTHKGFGKKGEVRNTFGPNMTFKREVLNKVGGFDEKTGKDKLKLMQGEESEICSRIREKYGRSMYYDPDIVVHHHVSKEQTQLGYLIRRSFYQGISKGYMSKNVFNDTIENEEKDFLKMILTDSIPSYIINGNIRKGLLSLILTLTVGLGFLYYLFKSTI
jgi:glycosyltransferase involved in cell wall biosynthesis